MTLPHSGTDEGGNPPTDPPAHHGLTDFGKQVVREMNRLGIIVDISHVSDKTFNDALEVSNAPMMASHSSCRVLCDAPRNLTDQMMKDLAAKGGVIQINYHVGFLSQEFRNAEKANPEINKAIGQEVQKRCGGDEACQLLEGDRKSTRLNSSHGYISYAVFCLKKKNETSAATSCSQCEIRS